MNKKHRDSYDTEKLLEIMARLRDPDTGCPWDVQQDFRSIAPYTVEEAYEVADAIERDNLEDLRDELGDLLLQVVFHAQMAAERSAFDFGDVVDGVCDKLIRRHPHVFGDETVASAEAQTEAWEQHKLRERRERGTAHASRLDGVPLSLPSLVRALKLGQRAARVGFDWQDANGVRDKLHEELAELDAELASDGAPSRIEAELGDVLFALANLARHLGIDAEAALRGANSRFETRFRHMESRFTEQGIDPTDATLEEMEALWQEAKRVQSGK